MINFLNLFKNYKFIIIALISVIILAGVLIEGRKYLISQSETTQNNNSDNSVLGYSSVPTPDTSSDTPVPSDTPTPDDTSVLGTSTNATNNNSGGGVIYFTPTPFPTEIPIPTLVIIPTSTPTPATPTPTPQAASNLSCTSDGDAYYSNAYVNNSNFPGSVSTGSTATVTIVLKDCNNQSTLNSDTITITPKNVDSTFQFVGFGNGAFTLPSGQFSFQVTDQNSGTDTFTIQDTTNNFEVTSPNYSSPTVTFTQNSPTSTPTAVPADTDTPTPAYTSTPTPSIATTVTPTSVPSPSGSPTSTPTPSVNLTPSPSPGS